MLWSSMKALQESIEKDYARSLHPPASNKVDAFLRLLSAIKKKKKGNDRLEVKDSLWNLTYIGVKPKRK